MFVDIKCRYLLILLMYILLQTAVILQLFAFYMLPVFANYRK